MAICALLALCSAAANCGSEAVEFDPWTKPARYQLTYRVELDGLPAEGRRRVWVPMPADMAGQSVRDLAISAPSGWRVTRDALGNRMFYVEFADGVAVAPETAVVMRFEVHREIYTGGRPAGASPERFIRPARLGPIDGQIRELADAACAHAHTTGERIRAIYDRVTHTLRYDKRGRGWGRGDAAWACSSGYGNCTDFHALLIAMARAEHIPARFTMGFPIPADAAAGEVAGYHCWAEAYDPSRGWIPMDASEAWKSRRFDAYFGKLPSDRVAFTVGRDLLLEPPQAGAPLNYFIYPYAEVDDKPLARLKWKLTYRRLPPTATTTGATP